MGNAYYVFVFFAVCGSMPCSQQLYGCTFVVIYCNAQLYGCAYERIKPSPHKLSTATCIAVPKERSGQISTLLVPHHGDLSQRGSSSARIMRPIAAMSRRPASDGGPHA